MVHDFFEKYDEATATYSEKVACLSKLKSFAKTKKGSKYAPDCEIFNIRGTRYFLILRKEYWPAGIGEFVSIRMSWYLRKKNKNEYDQINFEDVLDSNLISNKAKEDIVFNLSVFRVAA